MMKKESAGERIRSRRKALKLTQQALAQGIGVSHVAVSQWEKEETVPRGENLLRLAEWLQCTAAWIIDGDGELFAAPLQVAPAASVPLISLTQASGWLSEQRLLLQQQATRFLYSDNALSETGLAVELVDESMQPEYRPRDVLIFDPHIAPQPGDVVLAQLNDQALVRVYRQQNAALFTLRPLNADYPQHHSDQTEMAIIGVLVELRRYRQR